MRNTDAQPAEASVFVAQAIIAYDEQRYQDALQAVGEALKLDPDNADALYYSGLAQAALGRLDEAVALLEKARQREPGEGAVLFQLGLLYFRLNKYDQAQPLLEDLFSRTPRLDGLGYYVGFMRYRSKNYQGALRAFRAGASTDPDIQQLTRFYSSLALAALGLTDQAAAELEESLRLQPASRLTAPFERLKGTVQAARATERRLRASLRLGSLYDDNVAVNPANSGDPVVALLRGRDTSSTGELAHLKADYTFLRQGALDLTLTGEVFTTYYNTLTDFNILDLLGGVGGSYRGVVNGFPYLASLQYAYDYLLLGEKEFVQRHTVVPSLAVALNSWNLTALQARYQHKRYAIEDEFPLEERRTGPNYMAGFTHLFRFAEDKHLVKVGYQWDFDDLDRSNGHGRNYSYLGHRLLAGAQYTLPWAAIRLNYDFDVHFRDYRNKNSVFPIDAPGTTRRADTEYNHAAGLTVPLPYNLSFSVTYQLTMNRSNLDVFTYDRNVISGAVGWSY